VREGEGGNSRREGDSLPGVVLLRRPKSNRALNRVTTTTTTGAKKREREREREGGREGGRKTLPLLDAELRRVSLG